MRRVFDAFLFYRDFDQLDIRLHELNNVVDKFVLVECTKTFRGKDKPLWFNENKHLYKEWGDRIIHVIADKPPHVDVEGQPYHRKASDFSIEVYQRNAVMQGLVDCRDDDMIMISDCDEIPMEELVKKTSFDEVPFWSCMQRMYYYYMNTYFEDSIWSGTMAMPWRDLKISAPRVYRKYCKQARRWRIPERAYKGGWHFSHLVGNKENAVELIQEKMRISGHYELDSPDRNNADNLKRCMRELRGYHEYSGCDKIMKIDDISFLPKYVQENQERFKDYLYVNSID